MSRAPLFGAFVVAILGLSPSAFGQQDAPTAENRELLDKQRAALVDAFNRNDAAVWASLYAADAEFIHETGQVANGPAAIQKLFAKIFTDNKGIKLAATATNERVLTPQIVLEDGAYQLTGLKEGGIFEGRNTTIWVHRKGQWLLVSHRSWVPVKQPQK